MDRRGRGIAGTVTALVATGEPVLVVAADARVRARHLAGRLGGFGLTSWAALAGNPGIVAGYSHLVALDPPVDFDQVADISGPLVHLAWGADELRFAHGLLAGRDAPREALTALYRMLRADGLQGVQLSAWRTRELLAVLVELGLADAAGGLADQPQRRDLSSSQRFMELQARNEEGLRWLSSAVPRAA